jgi:hypothetical protein
VVLLLALAQPGLEELGTPRLARVRLRRDALRKQLGIHSVISIPS